VPLKVRPEDKDVDDDEKISIALNFENDK